MKFMLSDKIIEHFIIKLLCAVAGRIVHEMSCKTNLYCLTINKELILNVQGYQKQEVIY